jgi:hypothetical protein
LSAIVTGAAGLMNAIDSLQTRKFAEFAVKEIVSGFKGNEIILWHSETVQRLGIHEPLKEGVSNPH